MCCILSILIYFVSLQSLPSLLSLIGFFPCIDFPFLIFSVLGKIHEEKNCLYGANISVEKPDKQEKHIM